MGKLFIVLVACISLCTGIKAQSSKSKKTKQQVEEPPPPPPPPPSKIDMRLATDEEVEAAKKAPMTLEDVPNIPKPQVDFDTSAVVQDVFTKDIMKLIEITHAWDMGMQFAESMKNGNDNNPMMKEFYEKFIADMREGTAHRWMERIYIRHYRKHYTNDEVKELITFYQTPLGQKLISQTTAMMPGLMTEAQKMGQYIGASMMLELLKDKGIN